MCLALLGAHATASAEEVIVRPGRGAWDIRTDTGRFQVDPGSEVTVRGGFTPLVPMLEVVYADGTRDCALEVVESQVLDLDGAPTVRVDLVDRAYGLKVSAFTRALAELDMVEKWLTVENASTATIVVENAQSGRLALPKDEYDLIHLSGEWGREFMPQRGRLTPGVKTLQVRDFSHFRNPPWFALLPAGGVSDETRGPVWFGGLRYSGNWRLDFDKTFNGGVQVVGGMHFWDAHWTLRPGETFETPRLVVGRADDGLTGASHRMHRYIAERLLPAPFRDQLRPVLYNSWYATTFDVNEEHQLALARVAREIGVELFVIDDGWFKGRVNDRAGLGDWTVDKNKFPRGLGPMIEEINHLGLEFGIWVEPEMVNPDSDLYRAHPDWVFHFPNRRRHEQRNQLMLNLARDDVYEYLLASMTALLAEHNIRYIKWDRNRALTEPGWPDAPAEMQREVRFRYVANLYRLIDTLRERFPDVWFETCSGGGGRPDMGMLERMDMTWASDNTDPLSRIMIQHGYLHAFPARTMVSWVTHENWTGIEPSLDFRFQVSMAGVLGVGYDITEWDASERRVAARQIALYKQIRPVVQMGTVYRLLSPFDNHRAALQYVAQDGNESVVFLYNLWQPIEGSVESVRVSDRVLLQGLDPERTYRVEGGEGGVQTGRELMTQGLRWTLRGPQRGAIIRLREGDPPMRDARVLEWDSEASGHEAERVVDGNPYSFWHTEFGQRQPDYPHFVTIDLGRTWNVAALRLLQRQGDDHNGWLKDVELTLSAGEDLADPVLEMVVTMEGTEDWQTFALPEPVLARYLRIDALSPHSPTHPWAALAEVEVLEPEGVAPVPTR